jgi:hypothetical protein
MDLKAYNTTINMTSNKEHKEEMTVRERGERDVWNTRYDEDPLFVWCRVLAPKKIAQLLK